MVSTFLKIFFAFLLLEMHLAVEIPANCPVCRCPNDDESETHEPPVTLYSKQSNEDLASVEHSSTGSHIVPNEISNSAELFSREFLRVRTFSYYKYSIINLFFLATIIS